MSVDVPTESLSEPSETEAFAEVTSTLEAQLSRATQTEPSQPILWCSSPDDPRCRPAHGAPEGPQVPSRDVGSCIAIQMTLDHALTTTESTPRPRARGKARPGFTPSLEKPPRGQQ